MNRLGRIFLYDKKRVLRSNKSCVVLVPYAVNPCRVRGHLLGFWKPRLKWLKPNYPVQHRKCIQSAENMEIGLVIQY